MKITKVVPRLIRRDMGGTLWNPRIRWREKIILLVFLEYHMLHQWLWEGLPEGTFAVRNGFVRPPAGPGLGLTLTPDDVA